MMLPPATLPPTSSGDDGDQFLRLNIGGRRYALRKQTVVDRNPEGFLAALTDQVSDDYAEELQAFGILYLASAQEFYIERSAKTAEPIMDYFMTGHLHKPSDLCFDRFEEELLFWQVPLSSVSACCSTVIVRKKSRSTSLGVSALNRRLSMAIGLGDDPFSKARYFPQLRRRLWSVVEDPTSSLSAKVFAVISVVFVALSVTGLILSSMKELQRQEVLINVTSTTTNKTEVYIQYHNELPHDILELVELSSIVWFTFEFVSRYLICPQKAMFMRESLNVIDLLCICPFYVERGLLPLIGLNSAALKDFTGAMLVIRVMRVLRVARIFKLARYSTGLQAFGDTMKRSLTELSMLGMFLFTGIIFFSTVLYFLEKDEPNSKFYSIPAACWWCVVTMTTVGYGDVVPTTPLGKLVATIASVCGIIVLAFPISMIVEKFATAQEDANAGKQAQQNNVPPDNGGHHPPLLKEGRNQPNTNINDSSTAVSGGSVETPRRRYCGRFGTGAKRSTDSKYSVVNRDPA